MINFSNDIRKYGDSIAIRELIEGNINHLAYDIDKATIHIHSTHGERKHIAFLGENSSNWIILSSGAYASNNVVVSLDPSKESPQLIDLMKFADVTELYISRAQNELRKDHFSNLEGIGIHIMEDVVASLSLSIEETQQRIQEIRKECVTNTNDLAHVMFTSGTTSEPKGVMHSYKSLTASFHYRNPQSQSQEKVAFSISPYHHIYGLVVSGLAFLYDGKTICINAKTEDFIQSIALFEPEYITIVPAILAKLALVCRKQGVEKLRSIVGTNLTKIGIGGANMSPDDVRTMLANGFNIQTGYGATETAGAVLVSILSSGEECTEEAIGALGNKITPIGTEIKINEIGECLIKGPSIMMGYYKNEEATRKVLNDGWFNSQDIVRVEESGYYRCIGRSKNVIILANAENIYPEEIETKFYKENPQIEQCIVFENSKKINIAIYAPQWSLEQAENVVAEYNKSIPGFARIAEVFMRPAPMPTTAKGTIRRDETVKTIASEKKSHSNAIFTPSEEAIYKVISSIAEVEGIKPDTNMFDFGIDSLTALEIAGDLKINIEKLYQYPTIQKLAKFCEEQKAEETYDNDDHFNELNKQVPTTRKRVVLITGTTGFLGSYILRQLSAENSIRIVCLVRSIEKQQKVYQQYFGAKLPENVRIITGDITDKFLGMGFTEYSSLITEVDEVIHAAADVHHTGSFDKLYRTNVLGTMNVIELCKNAKAVLHHISTYSVSGIGVTRIESEKTEFTERDFWIGQRYKENVYVHTKYEAEKAVLKMRAEGYQANIYRVGSIAWDNEGTFQVNAEENGLLCRLKGLLECRTYPGATKESYFDITPVDDTAKAICTLFFSKNVNMTYHIFNPHFLTYKRFAELMNIEVNRTTISEFNKVNDDSKNVRTLKFYTNMSAESASIKLSAQKTADTLAQYGFHWKEITKEYLEKQFTV